MVNVCCVNSDVPLGSIADSSFREIWDGPVTAQLREAMNRSDYSLGCQACGDLADLGLRSASLAENYDCMERSEGLHWPRAIEFALSNTCNLQCVQCTGELSSSIRAQREHRHALPAAYGDEFFEEMRDFIPHLRSASFIGGEPFLMRECRRIWDLMIELDARPDVWVTTNGTVWNDRVERYLHTLQMGVSLSIDGVEPATIASIRVGADPEELLANRDRFLAATQSYGRDMKLNYCIMPQNWREFMPFLLDAECLGADVYAARVHAPAQHSLFHLPVKELQNVFGTMAEQGDDSAGRLVRNRGTWDDMLAQLSSQLSQIGGRPLSVSVDAPTRRRG